MLSGTSALPGVTSPSSALGSGREGFTPCFFGWNNALLIYMELVEHPGSFARVNCHVASSGLFEGAGFISSSTANGLVSAVVGAFGFPAVWLVPRLDLKEEDFGNITVFFFVDEEDVTHFLVCLAGILIGCTEDEYRCPSRRQCDKYCHARCSVGKGSDELASRRQSKDMGKGPRPKHCVSF